MVITKYGAEKDTSKHQLQWYIDTYVPSISLSIPSSYVTIFGIVSAYTGTCTACTVHDTQSTYCDVSHFPFGASFLLLPCSVRRALVYLKSSDPQTRNHVLNSIPLSDFSFPTAFFHLVNTLDSRLSLFPSFIPGCSNPRAVTRFIPLVLIVGPTTLSQTVIRFLIFVFLPGRTPPHISCTEFAFTTTTKLWLVHNEPTDKTRHAASRIHPTNSWHGPLVCSL